MKQFLIFSIVIATLYSCGTSGRLKFVHVRNHQVGSITPQAIKAESKNSAFSKVETEEGDPCDTLRLKNGEVRLTKIQSSNRDKVWYKKCDEESSGEYDVKKSELSSIHFSNGVVLSFDLEGNSTTTIRATNETQKKDTVVSETINQSPDKQRRNATVEEKKKNKAESILAVVFGGLSYIPVIGWIFSLLAIIIGSRVIRRAASVSDQERESKRAKIGVTLGTVSLIIGAILVVISIFIFIL